MGSATELNCMAPYPPIKPVGSIKHEGLHQVSASFSAPD